MEWLKELQELLKEQCLDLTRYEHPIAKMEQAWTEIKTFYAYVPSRSGVELFEPTDIRLSRAEQKLTAVRANPAIGMAELLQQVERNLRDWIADNQYGYLMDFKITETGIVNVEVSGMLSEHASYGAKTKAELFTDALEVLRGKGFTIFKEKNMNHYWFEDTDNNRLLLEEELKHINAKFIHYHTAAKRNNEPRIIRDYKFCVDIYELVNVEEKHIEPRTVLSADDFKSLLHDVNEFCFALSTIRQMPELTQTCLGVMEGIFANLCKMLKIENDTTREYYARFAEERVKNMRIREIEKEIASTASFQDFSKIIAGKLDSIEKILEEHDFFKNDFFLDCYGRATLTVTQSRLGYDNFKGFETFAAYGRADELEILDSETNKQKLENLIPMFEVSDMSIIVKDGKRCIRRVTYTCRNFL